MQSIFCIQYRDFIYYFSLQYDAQAHLTTLEQQIKKVQEKAEIDSFSSSWYTGDEDQTQEVWNFSLSIIFFLQCDNMFFCIFLQSLSSSPTYVGMKTESIENSEMEIDSKDFLKAETKQILADGDFSILNTFYKMFFEKNHLNRNISIDLHCSSEDDEADDDMMEEVKGEFDDMSGIDYNQTQVAAAEAMMQLGNFAYYSAGQKNSEYPGKRFDVLMIEAEMVAFLAPIQTLTPLSNRTGIRNTDKYSIIHDILKFFLARSKLCTRILFVFPICLKSFTVEKIIKVETRSRNCALVVAYFGFAFLIFVLLSGRCDVLLTRVLFCTLVTESLTATETYTGDVVDTRITENKTFDDDFLMCKEEMQDKRQYQELMSGVPEESGVVHDDLEISDSDDEMKEKNIDIPDKIVQSNVDNEDDDPDGLWF